MVFLVERLDASLLPRGEEATTSDTLSNLAGDLWPTALIIVITAVVARLLVTFVGDVGEYVADDPDTTAGRFRAHILSSVQGQLRALIEDPAYDTVHVVAHSLGTVVSYDAVNLLRTEVEHLAAGGADPDGEFMERPTHDRLGSLVTIACPLDHIRYALRPDGTDARPVQREILQRRR